MMGGKSILCMYVVVCVTVLGNFAIKMTSVIGKI